MAEPHRLPARESVALAGAADEDRHLVADQLAAAAGENRRTVDKAQTLLLVAAGGESPDPTALRQHAAQDRDAAVASRISRRAGRGDVGDDAGAQGEVSAESLGKRVISGRCVRVRCETGPPQRRWKHRVNKPGPEPCTGRPFGLQGQLESESENGNPD